MELLDKDNDGAGLRRRDGGREAGRSRSGDDDVGFDDFSDRALKYW